MTEPGLTGYQCAVCGSPDVMAVAPGTQADAQRFLAFNVADLSPANPVPTRAWCADHWRQSWTALSKEQ